ncbi:MAG: Fe-Mn family superoxide dismutase [Patescibacteria group bacterium]
MKHFDPKTFTLPTVEGISDDTLKAHVKLYEGYVKQANVILDKIEEYAGDSEKNAYALGELQRRFAFEFDGMRNHEYYFTALEGGPKPLDADSPLAKAIVETWGSVEMFMNRFKAIGLTRGIGWAMLYYDPTTKRLLTQWVDEQHLGHLTGLSPIVTLDVWEHAYLRDYIPADKSKYIEAYLNALNWETINAWFLKASA